MPSPRASTEPPLASIVIPVHNKATITRQCLDALLAEAPDGIAREIVVVDDGSRDGTPELLAAYGNRIRVVRNDSALGFAGACNAGVAAATGDLVILLNNDTIPTTNWLAALVNHVRQHPAAGIVGAKLLFPNETIQHAGVVFGLDREPHHLYAGFPADHPAAAHSRRFQAVTAACALFRRELWDALDGLDTAYHNGWEDVDFCIRAGEAGYEVHYCAESVIYHFESATRDLLSTAERANRALFASRWREKIAPDDFGYYWQDGLFSASYGARYPIKVAVSPLLGGVAVGEDDRLADRLLYDRARQVMILLRNNIVLNVRVQEAEARAATAERRLAAALGQSPPNSGVTSESPETPDAPSQPEPTPEPPSAATVENELPEPEEAAPVTPAAADPLPHRIVGMVESPGRMPDVVTDGVLIISGWTLTEAGDATIEIIVNGESRGAVPYGEPRSDAAGLYPGFPAGADCGFSGEIPVGDLLDGMHDVTVRITASDGARAELATTFEIDNHAFETGRVIGRMDLPYRGAIFIPREAIQVSGWALAPSGISSIDVVLDGEARGRVDYGSLRPDIARRRRQYTGADHCGFSGLVPLAGVPGGSHELTLSITANDGRQLELSTRIEVDATISIDAGLPIINKHYNAWLERRAGREPQADEPLRLERRQVFETIVPLDGACEEELQALAASFDAQAYESWRLTLVATATTSPAARELAQRLAADDARVTAVPPHSAGPIAALNTALAASSADWIAVLQPGVILSPAAFATIARSLAADPDADLLYTDDDRIDPMTTERWNPFFKPDWSPDLFLSMDFLGPLNLFRRSLALEAGGFRDSTEGAEVFDLVLRLTEMTNRVRHVPHVLVTSIESSPGLDADWHASDWLASHQRALRDALARRQIDATVERGLHPGRWRIRYALHELPGVTAVIPTGGKMHLLRPCLDDLLLRTDYPNLKILLVDNSDSDEVARLVDDLAPRFPHLRRVVNTRKPFNYPALNNEAVPLTHTPYVLLLNDDITVIDPGWLRAMVEHAQRPEVGIVGAKLLYPDNTIQHAGVILGPFGGSVHVFKRQPGHDPGFFDLPDVVRNCSAVTFACALIDRAVYDAVGGMDAENLPVAFNDVDFCLRAREVGFEVIYTPHATLYHHESLTKTVIAHPHEIAFLRSRWGHVIEHDPYYNPNLTRQGEDARLNVEATSAA